MRTLAIVPARGGSKGLPGKNIRPFAGKPLLVWSVASAMAVDRIDTIAVSSESDRVLDIAASAGAIPVKRPAELAGDAALPKDAVLHCLDYLEETGRGTFDAVVLLQPTSPRRAPEDISSCMEKVLDEGYDSCATFKATTAHPHRTWYVREGRPEPFMASERTWAPRQLYEPVYLLNGAVYVVRTEPFRKEASPAFLFGNSAAVKMAAERSFDIDTLMDFELAESAMRILKRQEEAAA